MFMFQSGGISNSVFSLVSLSLNDIFYTQEKTLLPRPPLWYINMTRFKTKVPGWSCFLVWFVDRDAGNCQNNFTRTHSVHSALCIFMIIVCYINKRIKNPYIVVFFFFLVFFFLLWYSFWTEFALNPDTWDRAIVQKLDRVLLLHHGMNGM